MKKAQLTFGYLQISYLVEKSLDFPLFVTILLICYFTNGYIINDKWYSDLSIYNSF